MLSRANQLRPCRSGPPRKRLLRQGKRPTEPGYDFLGASLIPIALTTNYNFDYWGEDNYSDTNGELLGAFTLPHTLAPSNWGAATIMEVTDNLGTDLLLSGQRRSIRALDRLNNNQELNIKSDNAVYHFTEIKFQSPPINATNLNTIRGTIEKSMKIKNHLLVSEDGDNVTFERSHNQSSPMSPIYLIMHYTAGTTTEGAVNWFKNEEAKASAHLVIGRDGKIVQMVPFNKKAWHAGKSAWGNLEGMNQYSIGIELVNAGKLRKRSDGKWVNWANNIIPDNEVTEATHKSESTPAGWHEYTQEQLDAAINPTTQHKIKNLP